MAKDDHQIIIPLSSTHWLEITSRLCSKGANSLDADINHSARPVPTTETSREITQFELPPPEVLPENILKVFESTHDAFTHLFENKRTFMIATTYGFQILRLDQILYFEYYNKRKQWTVVLSDSSCVQLKRSTIADDILNYSSSFVRINQQQIINIDYLEGIERNLCRLRASVEIADKLTISRTYFKALQARIEII